MKILTTLARYRQNVAQDSNSRYGLIKIYSYHTFLPGHQLRACIGEQRVVSSRDRDSATFTFRPLGHVLLWRGTSATKYTHSGRKAVKHKHIVGQGSEYRKNADAAGTWREAGRPQNRERRSGRDSTERLAIARTAAVLHPLDSAPYQDA